MSLRIDIQLMMNIRDGFPLKKSRFASEKEWKDSLPPGGRITSDIPNDDSDLLPGEVIYI